jgi:hypothetical protein
VVTTHRGILAQPRLKAGRPQTFVESNTTISMQIPRFSFRFGLRPRQILGLILPAALAVCFMPTAQAQADVHGLFNWDFSDHYITPRGLDTENQGIVVQPLLLLFWDLYSSKTAAIDDVSLTTGVWNDWDSHESGATPGYWNEIDPILGLTFNVEKAWQIDVFYTEFHSQTDSYPPSTNLDVKLTYHDSGAGGLTFNPYVEFFKDEHEKATVTFDPATSKLSYYFAFGFDPTYSVPDTTLKLELPTFINVVQSDFYQRLNGTPGGSGLAVFSTELKASLPLSFVSGDYGHWTAYIAEQYYHLSNDGVLDGNTVLATAKRLPNLYQFHTGVSIFF